MIFWHYLNSQLFYYCRILTLQALGFAKTGKDQQFVFEGNTARNAKIPFSATGVHMAITIWQQLTRNTQKAQINYL